mgnify:CR=1 FL=1
MILSDFARTAKIEGVALARKDGLVVRSKLPKGIDPNIIAAIGAKVVANAEMVSRELEKGGAKFIHMKASIGDVLIGNGKKIILISLIGKEEELGYLLGEMERVIKKLDELF